eukprot:3408689-Pyramimonas_sp.AAC.1
MSFNPSRDEGPALAVGRQQLPDLGVRPFRWVCPRPEGRDPVADEPGARDHLHGARGEAQSMQGGRQFRPLRRLGPVDRPAAVLGAVCPRTAPWRALLRVVLAGGQRRGRNGHAGALGQSAEDRVLREDARAGGSRRQGRAEAFRAKPGAAQSSRSRLLPARTPPEPVLWILVGHPAVGAQRRFAPLGCHRLRDDAARKHRAQRARQVWRELSFLEQPARGPAVHPASEVPHVAAAGGNCGCFAAGPGGQEHASRFLQGVLCGAPPRRHGRDACPAFDVVPKPELRKAAHGRRDRPILPPVPRRDGAGRAAPPLCWEAAAADRLRD